MRWDDSATAGFTTTGVRPWLPLPPSSAPNVAAQHADTGSTLWFCRQLIALRHTEIGAELTEFELLPGPPGLLAYQVGKLVVAANLSAEPAPLPCQVGQLLLDTTGAPKHPAPQQPAVLQPWQGIAARRQP